MGADESGDVAAPVQDVEPGAGWMGLTGRMVLQLIDGLSLII
jgi:hypothetical protein